MVNTPKAAVRGRRKAMKQVTKRDADTPTKTRECLEALGLDDSAAMMSAGNEVLKSLKKVKTRLVSRILSLSEKTIQKASPHEVVLWTALKSYGSGVRKLCKNTKTAKSLAKKSHSDEAVRGYNAADWKLYSV